MKKILYGTSALATIAAFAITTGAALTVTTGEAVASEPIKAEVRGYHYEYFAGSFQDVDETAAGDDRDPAYFDHHFDNEIHFKGMTTLDNGLRVGLEVQLEGRTDDDQIDEAFIFISGDDFGRFLIGDENGAAYLMTYQAPVPTTIDVNETEIGFVNGLLPDSFDLSDTAIDAVNLRANDNDSGKIMYFTPRIAGIQLGASYAAIAEGGGDDNSSDRTGDQWNNASLGLNYLEDFNGIGLALSGGFVYADTSQSGPNDGADDLYGVNTGFNVSFSGFTVGAGFAYQEGSEGTAAGGTRELLFDSYGYNVGLTYETGAYTFGAAYQRGKSSGLAGDGERNTLDQIVVGFNYVLGPGIAWELTGMWWDADGESRSEADIVAAGEETDIQGSDGAGIVSGITLKF